MSYTGPPFLPTGQFTYDLGGHIKSSFKRLTLSSALERQQFTLGSGTEVERAVQDFDSTSRILAEDFDSLVSNQTSLDLLHEGDDTAFDETYSSFVDNDVIVHAIDFNFAVALNVSAFTSGNFAIDSVTITMRAFKAQGQTTFRHVMNVPFTLANMTGVDNQYGIVNWSYFTPFQLYAGGMLEIQIQVNETTGTGTRQVGLLTLFPFQAQGDFREYYPSGFRLHYHPSPNHANVITNGGFAEYVPDDYAIPVRQRQQGEVPVAPIRDPIVNSPSESLRSLLGRRSRDIFK